MQTVTRKHRTSSMLIIGLLVLAGVFSGARSALAQTPAPCPLPAGVTPPADPSVTAQQVEDGSATLKEFVLAVRDRHRALSREIATFEGEAYFGCLIRQDGSPYRSGSTFLVSLSPDGSVLVHSKAMALSGRKLNPRIYGAIFQALGARGFRDLFAAANSDGGSFEAPDIPGASGYAAVYMSPGLGVPVILIAGFDLNETHLVEEAPDYGDPAVTASDVVDRETLKGFVTEAGDYLLELGKTGGRNAIWRAKDAMRDPDGPWRHGSVYLYVLDLASNLIMFHGAFPDRYEFRPLIATVRDAVTGELVLPQVIEAAKSNPEGGFVEYYFDDPADDTDSADIPKVGYALRFTGSFREPNGSFSEGDFIVGSGFYGRAPDDVATDPCPLPDGVALPADLAVTAQQVEAGTASLRDFALAVRDQFSQGRGSRELQLYVGCLLRQDGSQYNSGTTYLMQLTPDGRVFTHAKNMALSGRLLNRLIYGGILRALGINVAGLQGDPDAITAAFIEAAGRDGGAFDISGIPGASGYATVYFSTNFRLPIVLLAGFDLNESHLAEEEIEYVTPAVTARDVVDRETLKAFVTQAGEAFLNSQKGGDLSATSKARVVFRDPSGPWRHGSVYLYFLDLTSNIILFHGAFPDRYELRPLTATVRDAVTGKLVLPQVIEAAKSSPEGGFVEYFFDDPTDDTDRADIPKVGYARQFTGERERADGTALPVNFIVGSGFYGRSDDMTQAPAPCPLPDGVTPPADPAVTAQQVENGSGSLRDFALAARDLYETELASGSLAEALYIQCRIRQDGSPWHSGSTYLAVLTPDGRVFEHAKSMVLAGRLLNPAIYGTILYSLGISPTDLANLASPDPAIAAQAFGAVIGALTQRPDGAFDATVPIPGLSPGIPGASGHAAVYVSPLSPIPSVVLAGFDIGESHLVPISAEAIDYGDPAVTARDVVDRETLKAFVKGAEDYIVELLQTAADPSVFAKARIALRDPSGPWRHGSVYLYILDRTSNVILFHGAFPDRFEYRPLVATVRDEVTGELILPQVLAAAASDPEGGFVEYYFDDPTDDTDSADVPKVGYAREFTYENFGPDGTSSTSTLVIGSGFYGRAPGPDYVPDIALTVNPATLTEEAGAQTVTVTVAQAGTAVPVETVIPLALGGTATGEDYSVSGDLNVIIPVWGTEGSTQLTFTVVDDTVYESGGETIVVTASYNGQELSSATLAVTDSYQAPAAVGTAPAVTLEAGDSETVDAGPLFSGTSLSYTASSSDNGVVEAVMSGATLTVTGVRKGNATVMVAARNAAGEASLSVSVTVTAVAAEREAYTNILAAMGRSMLSGVSATIGGRFTAGGGRAITVGGRRIDGLASGISALAGLTGHRRQAASKEMALLADSEQSRGADGDYLLRTSAFSYALEDHTASGGLRWSVWGAGDLQNFQGEPGEGASYDGDLKTAYLGFDLATHRSWMMGIALSRTMGQSDYDVTVASGSLESRLTAVLPYLRWTCVTGLTDVWSIVGLGAGEVDVEDGTSDLSMRMGMVGARSRLVSSGGLGLDVVGDAGLLRLSTSDSESAALSDIATDVQRIRIGLEGSRATALAGGTTFTPYAQVAGRYDGGDGQTGQGLEVSGGLRLTGGRVGLNAQGRFLAVHTAEGYSENGVSLVAYLRANAGGRGLSMSVTPRMGAGTRDSGMMWRDRPLADSNLRRGSGDRSIRARVGYGLASSPTGVLITPFGDLYLDRDDRRRLRLGTRIGAAGKGSRIGSLELSGARVDRRGGETEHRIGLVGSMSF